MTVRDTADRDRRASPPTDFARVLITGASGLLGKALVRAARTHNLFVYGQIHRRRPPAREHTEWLGAEFDGATGVARFLSDHAARLASCRYLINCYGPLTQRDTRAVTPDDLVREFHHNVVVPVSLTRFLLRNAPLVSVVFIGFETVGEDKGYHEVLPYAVAKNALLTITRSFAADLAPVRFNMVSPVTLEGADVPRRGGRRVPPERVAETVLTVLLGKESGTHHRMAGGIEDGS